MFKPKRIPMVAMVAIIFLISIAFWDSYVRAGTLEFDGVPVDLTTSTSEDLVIVPGVGGNTQIGDGTGSNSNATSNDDLHITGGLEVDGVGYLDSGMVSGSNLISDTDSTDSLGIATIAWFNLYIDAIRTVSGTNLTLLPTSAYTIIGDASTAGHVAVNDDLFVSGILEVDGVLYADDDLVVGTSDLFVDNSLGRIGVGITNPQNTLDIEGEVVIGAAYSGTATAPDNGLLIQGVVGIGTTAPAADLHVAGNVKIDGTLTMGGLVVEDTYVPYTGADTAVNLGSQTLTTTGTGTFGEIIDDGLTASLGVYTDASSQLTSTIPTTGDLGFWNKTGTDLTQATANDDIYLGSGVVKLGSNTNLYNSSFSMSNCTLSEGGSGGFNTAIWLNPISTPSSASNEIFTAIGGYNILATDFITGKMSGLVFGNYTAGAHGNATMVLKGIEAWGIGGYYPNVTAHEAYAIHLQSTLNGNDDKGVGSGMLGGTYTLDNIYTIKAESGGKISGTIGNEYVVWVGKPTIATNNYQLYLEGHGVGSGIWFDGAERLYSDDTNLVTASPFLALDKIKFTQTDGNEYIDSLADGYMDLGATTGIRLTAPLTTVTGSAIVSGTLTVTDLVIGSSAVDENTYVPYTGADTAVNLGSETLTTTGIVTFGKIITGSASSNYAFNLNATSNAYMQITNDATGIGWTDGLWIGIAGSTNKAIIYNGETTDMDLGTNSTTRMVIKAAGDVEIINDLTIDGLTASLGVYTDASKQLTSTVPDTGALGHWSRTGTDLSTAHANDTVFLGTGGLTFGTNSNTTTSALNISNYVLAGTASSFNTGIWLNPMVSPTEACSGSFSGLAGYVSVTGSLVTGKSVGLIFGNYTVGTAGNATMDLKGIETWATGGWIPAITGKDAMGIHVQSTMNGSDDKGIATGFGWGNYTFDNIYTIKAESGGKVAGTIGNEYVMWIGKPTIATTNYQLYLEGNGVGSGIWFDGAERLYSDGTNLTSAAPMLALDKIKFTQTDGNQYIDSLADGYMDLGATTGIRLNDPTTVTGLLTTDEVIISDVIAAGTEVGTALFIGSDGKLCTTGHCN